MAAHISKKTKAPLSRGFFIQFNDPMPDTGKGD